MSQDYFAIFWAQKVRPGPHINEQKRFCELFRFREDIRIWSSKNLTSKFFDKSYTKILGYIEIVPIYFVKNLIFSIKARRGLQRQNWCRANFGFPQIFRKINMWGLVSHRYSYIFKVWLRAVLACVESLISRKSPRKRIVKRNILRCSSGAQMGSIHDKNALKSCDTANLTSPTATVSESLSSPFKKK